MDDLVFGRSPIPDRLVDVDDPVTRPVDPSRWGVAQEAGFEILEPSSHCPHTNLHTRKDTIVEKDQPLEQEKDEQRFEKDMLFRYERTERIRLV